MAEADGENGAGDDRGRPATPNPIREPVRRGEVRVEVDEVVTTPSLGRAPEAGLVQLEAAPDGSDRLFAVDQRGVVHVYLRGEDRLLPEPFLDLRESRGDALFTEAQQSGLRSLAFHPDFAREGSAGYGLVYTASSETEESAEEGARILRSSADTTSRHGVVAEWRVDPADPDRVDPDSRREVLRVEQSGDSHALDLVAFNPTARPGDPDYGKLYVGVGDGAYAMDGLGPPGVVEAQDPSTAPGSVLRIDPLPTGGGEPYSVPADNPFVGREGYLPEVWAYGLRNPERFSWDPQTGKMLITDIGQGNVEEVNLGAPGANYGWELREGTFVADPLDEGRLYTLTEADAALGFADPVAQYDHDDGTNAVAGGFVYRGQDIPELYGRYVFGDIPQGRLSYAPADEFQQGRQAEVRELTLLDDDGERASFKDLVDGDGRADLRLGQDAEGELLLISKQDNSVRALRREGSGEAGGGGASSEAAATDGYRGMEARALRSAMSEGEDAWIMG